MTKLTSMKMSEKQAKEYMGVAPSAGDAPKYPYGLCLYLDTDTLKKLGMSEPPAVGSKMTIVANVEVVSVGMSQQRDGDKETRAELQITDMAVDGDKPAASEKLYGGASK